MDLKGCVKEFFRGVIDSFRGVYVVFKVDKELNKRRTSRFERSYSHSPIRRRPFQTDSREQTPIKDLEKHEDSTVMSSILQCGLLNGAIYLCSILFFEYVLSPLVYIFILFMFGSDSEKVPYVWSWIELIIYYIFQTVWVVPLFTISKFINNLWFQDIGHSAYKYSRGRSNASLSLSKTVADFIFSSVVETLFLVQAIAMTYAPFGFFGRFLYIIHLSLLYSLYAYEYKWGEMGWEISKRLTCVETNWSYFIGFGLPLALCTQISQSVVISGSIFSILFPIFIISANEANPGSGKWPRVKIFSPVIFASNAIFTVVGKERRVTPPVVARAVPHARR